jgi:hypothetical protein
MPVAWDTIRVGRRIYAVEPVTETEVHQLPVRFILHDPAGRKYLLLPDCRRPDRLVAIAPITHFTRYRPGPCDGVSFAVEGGKLVIAASDESRGGGHGRDSEGARS